MCGIHFRVDRFENRCKRCGKILMGEDTYFEEEQLCESCLANEGNVGDESMPVVDREAIEEKTKPEN